MVKRKCFSYSDFLFKRLCESRMVEKQVKKKIARNLMESTNLPVKEIAKIVELPEDAVKPLLNQVNRKRRFSLVEEESTVDRISERLSQINENSRRNG